MPMLRRMMRTGIAINLPKLKGLSTQMGERMRELEVEVRKHVPQDKWNEFVGKDADADEQPGLIVEEKQRELPQINVNSAEQMAWFLFDVLGLGAGRNLKRTADGHRISTGKKQLELLKEEHGVIQLLLEYRENHKLKTTYADALPKKARLHPKGKCPICSSLGDPVHHLESHHRIHTTFTSTRTETGRYACVSGDTVLDTSRGSFRIDEYEPTGYDTITTHKGRQRRIVRKFLKGIDEMYRVCLTSGASVTCTMDHKFWTPSGWLPLRQLAVKSEVFGVHLPERYSERGTSEADRGELHSGSDKANCDGDREAVQNYLLNSASHLENRDTARPLQNGKDSPVLAQPNGSSQSNVRQDRGATSQLDWVSGRPERLSHYSSGRRALLCTSGCVCECFGDSSERPSIKLGDSSHRREPKEQSHRQSGSTYSTGAQTTSPQAFQITAITPMGPMAVWDIEVEEDHSYLSQGIFHHNSKSPNLQNIPARSELGELIRSSFIASPGYKLVSADHSQIELRTLAHCAGDRLMRKIFREGGDIHDLTTAGIFKLAKVDKKAKTVTAADGTSIDWHHYSARMRAPMKAVNFGVVYGLTPIGLQAQLALSGIYLSEDECAQLIAQWFGFYTSVLPYMNEQHYRAKHYGLVWDMWGRVRYTPGVYSVHPKSVAEALREAGNQPIQAGATGMMKLGMWDMWCRDLEAFRGEIEVNPLLTVHDELIEEAPEHFADDLLALNVQLMCDVAELAVPIGAAGSAGYCWEK